MLGAFIGIVIYTLWQKINLRLALDAVIPGTLFAQGIARWGNYFNQELYGPPTDAPWGIAIDCLHRIAQYPCAQLPEATTGFHPLFFYESALNILGGLIALGYRGATCTASTRAISPPSGHLVWRNADAARDVSLWLKLDARRYSDRSGDWHLPDDHRRRLDHLQPPARLKAVRVPGPDRAGTAPPDPFADDDEFANEDEFEDDVGEVDNAKESPPDSGEPAAHDEPDTVDKPATDDDKDEAPAADVAARLVP